nr:MAG TPA: cysteine-rich protein [Caudoviricetes sp.]
MALFAIKHIICIDNMQKVLYNITRGDILNPSRFTWYPCPKCGSKLLAINKDTEVKNLPCKCKHCRKESLITIVPYRADLVKS